MPMPRKPDPERKCQHCGKSMARKHINGRLEDLGAFNRRHYCTRKCMGRSFVKDVPSKSALLKRISKYRGDYCEVCGATEKIHAHHIDGSLLNDSPENIQTLCASCHITHHHHARRVGQKVPGRVASHG